MDESHLLATVRYVERNPVTAHLCLQPWDWPWSSAAAHIAGQNDALVSVQSMLSRVTDWTVYLTESRPTDTEVIQRHTRTGRPLGNQAFLAKMEALTNRVLVAGRPGRKPQQKGTE